MLKDWVLSLPKMLWQLRSNHVETSRVSTRYFLFMIDINLCFTSQF